MNFIKKLEARMDKVDSLICVGLDPVLEKIPKRFIEGQNLDNTDFNNTDLDNKNRSSKNSDIADAISKLEDPIFEFNKWIINQTNQHVCAYKPNSAFYESHGAKGIESLKKTCNYIHNNYPDIPVIIDAKRGDIGHSNAEYAKFIFKYLKADAVTLQPYLGSEALSEFFKYQDKGLIILCRTSNSGAGEFQDLLVSDDSTDNTPHYSNNNSVTNVENKTSQNMTNKLVPLWQKIALEVSTTWGEKSKASLLLVVGATYPEELKKIRQICPDTTFLVPGVGSQGGSLEKTLAFGLNKNKKGVIINSSRGIIYSQNPKQAVFRLWKSCQKYY